MKRLRALVFAYACDPQRGSESAAGWAVVRAIARFADPVVLVGPEHEEAIRTWQSHHPSDCTAFVIVPEPWWARFIARTRIGYFVIFLGWLAKARAAAIRLSPRSFDFASHATYSAYWLPTPAAALGIPCVWGPVGGGVTTPAALRSVLGPAGLLGEVWDFVAVRAMALLPQTRRTWRHVAVALVQNDETLLRLPAAVRDRAVVLNHALLTPRLDLPKEPRGPFVVFAGSLESRKAPSLVIRALVHADPAVRVVMIGGGPERPALERLADRLRVRDRVIFAGSLPRPEVLHAWRTAAAGVFTGLREEGGIALAEAMLAGAPAIVLAHGGARTIAESATDPERIALITPGPSDATARAIGRAMSRFVLQRSTRVGALIDEERAAVQLETVVRRFLAPDVRAVAAVSVSEVVARG